MTAIRKQRGEMRNVLSGDLTAKVDDPPISLSAQNFRAWGWVHLNIRSATTLPNKTRLISRYL
jgi:hypothetical protein